MDESGQGDVEHIGSERPSDSPPPEGELFQTIEAMQAASEAEGWSIEYRQMEPGPLRVSAIAGFLGDITLLHECSNRSLELVGEPPEGHLTVLAPIGTTQLWANGQTVDHRRLLLIQPGEDLHFFTGANADVVSMHIPMDQLLATSRTIQSPLETALPSGTTAIASCPASLDRLTQLMRSAIYRPGGVRASAEASSNLMAALLQVVGSGTEDSSGPRHGRSMETSRILRRAREYVESHLDRPIPIGELCAYAAVSLSKLERTFRRELGMSPTRYILARRLGAVNRKLKYATSLEIRVSGVALDYGFAHLGRFASAYRGHFGELPSETLRQTT